VSFEAKLIADSISPAGIRLRTFQLRYPRFIHAEFMTHRKFSRNASSSRAIPVKRLIEDIRRDPAMPIYWGSNKSGMQAGVELTGSEKAQAEAEWIIAMNHAIKSAEFMIAAGLHKQIANRILEPWAHINVVCSGTEFENFYALRRHKDAQPEIKRLADLMWEAEQESKPKLLQPGRWHLPYITQKEKDEPIRFDLNILRKVSVARCARVSYLTHDGRQTSVEEDLTLFNRLVGAQPLHASPAEHQATPDEQTDPNELRPARWEWKYAPEHGNFVGWRQYRKTLEGEFIPG
jgi:hypothetical protein